MKVADAIKYLREEYNADQQIVIAWWGPECFEGNEMETALDNEYSVDWSVVHEQLTKED